MNVISHLQSLLMLVLGITLSGEELALGEREGRIGEATYAAIRRFLATYALTLPEELEEQSPEWFQWLIQQLEAVRKADFVVFGQIRHSNELPISSARVQAFDRDLPSLERRMESGPQLLGEAISDAEGGFRIPYTFSSFY